MVIGLLDRNERSLKLSSLLTMSYEIGGSIQKKIITYLMGEGKEAGLKIRILPCFVPNALLPHSSYLSWE